jgi:TonB family protein
MPGPAAAEISGSAIEAFDEARTGAGDAARAAAARQLGDEALANPEDARAGRLAFDAALTICQFARCADGRPYAAFAAEAGTGDDLPPQVERTLLNALATWDGAPTQENFLAFGSAVDAIQSSPPTPASILAYERFYFSLGGKDDLHGRFVISTLAANHIRPLRDEYPMEWANMELRSIAHQHSESRDPKAAGRVADLQIWLLEKVRASAAGRERFGDIYYQAAAWNLAIAAYHRSGKYYGNQELDKARYRLEQAMEAIPDMSGKPGEFHLPRCSGTFVKPPKLLYPTGARIRGYVGAAILGYDLVDGEVRNISVLASVPSDVFDEYAVKAMQRAKWKFDKVQEKQPCDRSGPLHGIYSFEFLMQ